MSLRNRLRNRGPGVSDTAHPQQLGLRIDIAFRKTLTAACLGHSLHGFNVAAHAVVIALATPSALHDVCWPCVPDMTLSTTLGEWRNTVDVLGGKAPATAFLCDGLNLFQCVATRLHGTDWTPTAVFDTCGHRIPAMPLATLPEQCACTIDTGLGQAATSPLSRNLLHRC